MARRDSSIWHTLGRTVETAVATLPNLTEAAGRSGGRRTSRSRRGRGPDRDPLVGAAVGATSAFLAHTVTRWVRERRPSLPRLIRGAAAGAGAAGVVLALRALLDRDAAAGNQPARDVADELLAGAGRGVLYAALLSPLLPGPPLLRGAVAGTADYVAAPLGGLFSRLQPLSPIRKVPVISILLETGDAERDPYRDFLLYGVALGLLYGDESRGG